MAQVEFIGSSGVVEPISLKGPQTKPFKVYGGLTLIPVSDLEVQAFLVARGKVEPTPDNSNQITVQEYKPTKQTPWGRLKQEFHLKFDCVDPNARTIYPITLNAQNPSASVRYEQGQEMDFTVRLSLNTALPK